MNETEIGILALGGLIVLGVIAYNKWQERQHRRNMEESFQHPGEEQDVLLTRRGVDFSISPAPDAAPAWGAEEPVQAAEKLEPLWQERAGQDEAPVRTEAGASPEGSDAAALPEEDPLSPMIDLIAELKSESPVNLAALRRDYAKELAPFGRRLNWAGLDELEGTWEFLPGHTPEGGGRYRRLRAGLQLVDREGVVETKLIAHFLEWFPKFAENFRMTCQLPEGGVTEWLEQARQLDVFCAGLDIVLCLSLVAGRGRSFAGTQIRALAEAENMVLENGFYILRDEQGTQLFCFWNTDETHPFRADEMKHLQSNDLTFQFDVPCVPRGQQVYLQMLATIRRFAKVMQGYLIDDQGNPLSDETLEQIRQDYVIRPQTHMMNEGLPAGSFLARRLFS